MARVGTSLVSKAQSQIPTSAIPAGTRLKCCKLLSIASPSLLILARGRRSKRGHRPTHPEPPSRTRSAAWQTRRPRAYCAVL